MQDDDLTRTTAHLPGLDIDIARRRSLDGLAEHIAIRVQAVPALETFGRYFEAANSFASWRGVFWRGAAQMAILPWLAAAQAFSLPWQGTLLPKPDPD